MKASNESSSSPSLLQDHIAEVMSKWHSIDDEIWAKIIVLERNRRVAKAYARAPVLTVNGSDDGFDGFRDDKKTCCELHPVQGDRSCWRKPPVYFKTKVPLLPGKVRPGQAKTELLFLSQLEVLDNVMCHPVHVLLYQRMDFLILRNKCEKKLY